MSDGYSREFADSIEDLAGLVAHQDMARAVPTCPGWSLGQLIEHVGHLNRWAAEIIGQPEPALVPWDEVSDSSPSDYSAATLADWLPGSQQAVADAVRRVGPDTPVWTFIGIARAGWWMRRLLDDSLMHRADAAITLGRRVLVSQSHVEITGHPAVLDGWLDRTPY